MEQYTVSTLTGAIHKLLRNEFDDVRVAGEISGFKVWSSGHAYFTLKDAGAQIRCVIFRGSLRYLRFQPGDGLAVVARGTVEVRQERGEYQLIVSSMAPDGVGALQAAFELLKQKLADEGLFAAERKRALPVYPRRIGIVTSPKGAVIRDMITVLSRRWPGVRIRLWPTQVQGAGAIEGVCAGLRHFSESGWADVVIAGRGGGSLEDLWTFNEEAVARAIADSAVPVVSAVGHETDFTIADFVADLRAPTPSAAAEMVVRDQSVILGAVQEARQRAARAIRFLLSRVARRLQKQGAERAANLVARQIGRGWQAFDELDGRLRAADPRARLMRMRTRLEMAARRLAAAGPAARIASGRACVQALEHALVVGVRARLHGGRLSLEPLAARLGALSPVAILERGYAIVTTEQGAVVKAPEDAPSATNIRARVARGVIKARVT
jgi:exodeoxyribonuclease VII large subunit